MKCKITCLYLNKTVIYENSIIDLESLQRKEIEGVMFRSKAQWVADGEKNSKYFYNLEKAKFNAKTCHKLIINDIEVTHFETIMEAQVEFYRNLYRSDENIKFSLDPSLGVKVPQEMHNLQAVPLSMHKIGLAVLKMQNNKTPGKDGIPVDV